MDSLYLGVPPLLGHILKLISKCMKTISRKQSRPNNPLSAVLSSSRTESAIFANSTRPETPKIVHIMHNSAHPKKIAAKHHPKMGLLFQFPQPTQKGQNCAHSLPRPRSAQFRAVDGGLSKNIFNGESVARRRRRGAERGSESVGF
jgi:hypothetical protein